jgi:hypothetical protein
MERVAALAGTTMNNITSETFAPHTVGPATRRQMFELMVKVYEAVDEATFIADLEAKDFVILTTCDDAVVGFTTGVVRSTIVGDRPVRHVFSGDTVINPDHWGPGHFFPLWFNLMGRIKAAEPDLPLYWFLVAKGHRTYRFMTGFFRDYVPKPGSAVDKFLVAVRDVLSVEKFGSYYDPASGLIDFGKSKGHLVPSLQDAAELANGNRIVRDFVSLNPEYGRGVELACVAELSEANLRSLGAHRFGEGYREGTARFGAGDWEAGLGRDLLPLTATSGT